MAKADPAVDFEQRGARPAREPAPRSPEGWPLARREAPDRPDAPPANSSLGWRVPNNITTRSANSRRPTNASTCAQARSNHCASFDDARQRALFGRLRQQAKRRQTDERPIRHRALAQPERDRQRIALGSGESIEPLEQRHAKLMQCREGKLHLGLDPGGADRPHVRRRCHRILKQCGFADPGLALEHEDPAAPCPRALEQAGEDGAFLLPTAQ